jgi:hypothetical protein
MWLAILKRIQEVINTLKQDKLRQLQQLFKKNIHFCIHATIIILLQLKRQFLELGILKIVIYKQARLFLIKLIFLSIILDL